MKKIRKGDLVISIAGKSKGQTGSVLEMLGDKVKVTGLNQVIKHQKPNPAKGDEGGRKSIEMPLHISNIALYNPATKKADRVGIRLLEDGRKVRYFKSNNEIVDV